MTRGALTEELARVAPGEQSYPGGPAWSSGPQRACSPGCSREW